MAYERNSLRSVGPGSHILGSVVEYDASRRDNSSGGWRWAVYAVVAVAVLLSFVSARGCFRRKEAVGEDAAPAEAPKKISTRSLPVRQVPSWAEYASGRSSREKTLLSRLDDAERQGRLAIAVDTIEQLRAIPSMADLEHKLARRLGDLNIERLFSGEPVPWVVETKVRRGQTIHRIAREHGTTVAALLRLNALSPDAAPKVGDTLRVLEFVRATFVVHKQMRYADLMLNGKLFKRYYVSVEKNTAPGAYPITSASDEGPRSRLSALKIGVFSGDMRELDMFLAPGSVITISEM